MNLKDILKFCMGEDISLWKTPEGLFKFEHIDRLLDDTREFSSAISEYKRTHGLYGIKGESNA